MKESIIGLRVGDVVLTNSPAVRIHGKGRKNRSVPLWRTTAAQLRDWLRQRADTEALPLFPNRSGAALSRSALTERLALAVAKAAERYPQLRRQRISPHTVRHSTAMHLLQSGVDITVIALWLGHESPATTHFYVEADMSMKEKALGRLHAPRVAMKRFRPPDQLLQFLQSL